MLRGHCDAEGRDYDTIEKTVMVSRPILDDVDAFLADAEAYAALGVDEIQILPVGHPVEFTEQVAELIMPKLAGVGSPS